MAPIAARVRGAWQGPTEKPHPPALGSIRHPIILQSVATSHHVSERTEGQRSNPRSTSHSSRACTVDYGRSLRCGGKIRAENGVDGGARFHFTLPHGNRVGVHWLAMGWRTMI